MVRAAAQPKGTDVGQLGDRDFDIHPPVLLCLPRPINHNKIISHPSTAVTCFGLGQGKKKRAIEVEKKRVEKKGVEKRGGKADKAHEGNRTLDLFFTKEVLYH